MSGSPKTWQEMQQAWDLPPTISDQRFVPPSPGATDVTKFYPISQLRKAVDYLLKVHDRMLPVAFFAEPRYGFTSVIDLYHRLNQWDQRGYTHVLMIHGPDPRVSVHQPFGRYYVWQHRLKTLSHIEPVSQ